MGRSRSSRSFRRLVLTGVSAFALSGAALGITAAEAVPGEENRYELALAIYLNNTGPFAPPFLNTGVFALKNMAEQLLLAPVDGTVGPVSITFAFDGDPTNASVDLNSILAEATGNEVVPGPAPDFTALDLSLLAFDATASAFVGQSAVQAAIQAAVTVSGIGADGSNILDPGSSLSVSGNTIEAIATVNRNTPGPQAAGPLDITQTSGDPGGGGVTYSLTGDLAVTTQGTLAITSVQLALDSGQNAPGGGSFAAVSDSAIYLTDQVDADSPPLPVLATFALRDNRISAAFTGNLAENGLLAEAGGGSLFTGSVAVTTGQLNLDTLPNGTWVEAVFVPAPPNFAATVQNSEIVARIAGGAIARFGGTLTVSGNGIGATATGNEATSFIVFEEGLSVVGAGGETANALGYPALSDPQSDLLLAASLAGDLTLLNVQANQGSFLGARVLDSRIAVELDVLEEGGLVALLDNAILARAYGNLAANRVAVAGATLFDATVALGNLQTNSSGEGTAYLYDGEELIATASEPLPFGVVALNQGSRILASLGGSGFSDPDPEALVQSGLLAVAGNLIGATAKGNAASNLISLEAASLTADDGSGGPASAATTVTDAEVIAAIQAAGGVTLTNLQSNVGADARVLASVSGAVIGIDVSYRLDEGLLPLSLAGGVYSVEDNAITAEALGNEAANAILLSGLSGAVTAALASAQNNEAAVTAEVLASYILLSNIGTDFDAPLLGDGQILGSLLSLSGNEIAALALANRVENLLAVTGFTSLALRDSAPDLFGDEPAPSAEALLVTDVIGPLTTLLPSGGATGNFVLLNSQWNQGAVTATLGALTLTDEPPFVLFAPVGIEVLLAGDLRDTTVTVAGNSALATALANQAANELLLEGLALASGGETRIASLLNLQGNAGPVSAGNVTDIDIYVTGSGAGVIEGALLSVADNLVLAAAGGNLATNRLEAKGIAHLFTDPAEPAGTLGAALVGTDRIATAAAYALLSVQANSGDIAALVSGYIGVVLDAEGEEGAIRDSLLSVAGNSDAAVARGNAVSNLLALQGTALADSAALANLQVNSGGIQAEAFYNWIGLRAGSGAPDGYLTTGSLMRVEDNAILALALGNAALNRLTLSGEILAGRGGGGLAGYEVEGDLLQALADLALLNGQYAEGGGGVLASVRGYAFIGVQTDGSLGQSLLSVSGNLIAATAGVNSAANSLTLKDAARIEAAAALVNSQVSWQSATAEVGGGIGLDALQGAAGAVLNIRDNAVLATAFGNSAGSALNVGGTWIGGGGAGLSVINADGAGIAAGYALYSYQESNGPINASASAAAIGTPAGLAAAPLASIAVAVNGNQMMAQALGNGASNAVQLNALAGSPSAALVSIQVNRAAVTATVSGGWIGVAGDPGSSGWATVNGNAVGAVAVGNSVTSSIKSGLKGSL